MGRAVRGVNLLLILSGVDNSLRRVVAARCAAVRLSRNTSPRAPAGALSIENKYASVSTEQPEIPSCDSVLKLDHDEGQG